MKIFFLKRKVAALAVSAIALPAIAARLPAGSLLSPDGLSQFRIGMTLEEVNRLLDQPIIPSDPALRLTPNCDYAKAPGMPGVAFVFIGGKLSRIDVQTTSVRSMQGLAIGDRRADVLKFLPNAKQEPLDHVPDGLSLILEDNSAPNAMSFQLEGGRLTRIIAGNKRAILYSEGCD